MKKFIILLLFFASHLIFCQNVVINEIMSSNNTTIYDEDGDTPDWIELYNTSLIQINLKGYFLSDDSINITKWQFGNAIIEPGEYLVVFASDKNIVADYWHTNFKISSSGEEIALSDTSGLVIDKIDVPNSLSDVSYARLSDGSLPWIFQIPTPGSENTGKVIHDYSDSVFVSLQGGFYSSTVSVELSAGTSNIYYTIDGSNPDSTSAKYMAPINIGETTVLKAVSMKENYLTTDIIHHTYLINEKTKLPVVSISTDPDNFFNSDSGIYVHYEEDWERPAHIEFFDDDKNLGFSENVGINIYGGYTRRFDQKSLAVKFKSKYGKNKLEYDLFPGFKLKEFKSFILRNSGNDFDQTHIRDAFMQTLVKDLDIDYLEYRPAVTYINGEYWGIYNIREKISEHYVASRHGVNPDNIDMMEGYSAYNDDENDPDGEYGLWVGNLEAIHGDTSNYKQLIDYLNTEDLSTDEAYNFVDSMIDIDECLLYYAAHVYYNSQDWPANNSKYWRERSPEGKWRWILYDLDFGFNLYEYNNEGNSENHVDYLFSGDPSQRSWSKPVESTFIPRKIVENEKIKIQFVNQVADLLNTNFKIDRVKSILNDIANHIVDDIGRHRAKYNKFATNLDRMISFANERPAYLRDHIRYFFNSGSDGRITINSTEGGSVKLNSLYLEKTDLPWSGKYFRDNPIKLKAIAKNGYKFDGWSGTVTSNDKSITISVTGSTNIEASFSIDSSTTAEIVINEINYNSANDFASGDWIELYNRSNRTINISDWYFSDSNNNHKFIFPVGTVINPNEYLVLVESSSAFTSLFQDVGNYIGETGFGLSSSGEFIKLVTDDEELIDSLTYSDNLPWPIEADGTGATLELIDAGIDNSKAENWKASIEHGTPGKLNSFATSVHEEIRTKSIQREFLLSQNYPNPFNPETLITYSIPSNEFVKIKVYDSLGRLVETLVNGEQFSGTHSIKFNASNLSSGVYVYRIEAGNFRDVKQMLLIK